MKRVCERSFRCLRGTIVHAPVWCLSARTRRISSYQRLLEAALQTTLRRVLHMLHRIVTNRRSRGQDLPALRRRPPPPQSRLLRMLRWIFGLVSHSYDWGRRSFSFACILRAWTNHNAARIFSLCLSRFPFNAAKADLNSHTSSTKPSQPHHHHQERPSSHS